MKKKYLISRPLPATLILFLVGILNPAAGYAQLTKDTTFLNEVVITASKIPQSKGNVTQKIEVLSMKEIENTISGNRNISDILQNQPGTSISVLSRNDANWGTYSGIGPKYSTFMLQGIPIDAFIDPMVLDLSAIDRIEVQRGPASVLYPNYLSQDFAGNQSPLAGTVNLILKEKFAGPVSRFSTSFGSYNTLNGHFYHQDVSKNTSYFAGIDYEMSDYTDYGTKDSWLNMQKNPEYRKTKIFGGISWFSDDDKQKLTFFVNKTFHTGDAGRLYRGFANDYDVINAGYTLKVDENICFQAQMGYRSYNRTWQESHFNQVDSLTSNNGMVQHIIPADVSLTVKHGKSNVLTTGIDYQGADYCTVSDPLLGYENFGNKSIASQTGIFLQEELHFGKLVARAGLRGNFIKNTIEFVNGVPPGQKNEEWNKLLYSSGLRYNPTRKLSFFANVGNSFITPGLKSAGGTILLEDTIHSGQLPNPGLKPESGLGIDAGFDVSLPLNFQVSLRGFNITVDDAIVENVVRRNPSQTQSVNAGKTSSGGIEFEIKQIVSGNFSWYGNLTYLKTKTKNPLDPDLDGAEVPFSPELIANAGIAFTSTFGLQIVPALNYNNGFFDSSSKAGRRKFTPGTLLNIFISQEIIKSTKQNVSIFGRFYNVTNNQYEMPWQFKNTGFSAMCGLKFEF